MGLRGKTRTSVWTHNTHGGTRRTGFQRGNEFSSTIPGVRGWPNGPDTISVLIALFWLSSCYRRPRTVSRATLSFRVCLLFARQLRAHSRPRHCPLLLIVVTANDHEVTHNLCALSFRPLRPFYRLRCLHLSTRS